MLAASPRQQNLVDESAPTLWPPPRSKSLANIAEGRRPPLPPRAEDGAVLAGDATADPQGRRRHLLRSGLPAAGGRRYRDLRAAVRRTDRRLWPPPNPKGLTTSTTAAAAAPHGLGHRCRGRGRHEPLSAADAVAAHVAVTALHGRSHGRRCPPPRGRRSAATTSWLAATDAIAAAHVAAASPAALAAVLSPLETLPHACRRRSWLPPPSPPRADPRVQSLDTSASTGHPSSFARSPAITWNDLAFSRTRRPPPHGRGTPPSGSHWRVHRFRRPAADAPAEGERVPRRQPSLPRMSPRGLFRALMGSTFTCDALEIHPKPQAAFDLSSSVVNRC